MRKIVFALVGLAFAANAGAQEISPELLKKYDGLVGAIVKATSAKAMVSACTGVALAPASRQALEDLLRINDQKFGEGASKRDVARKIQEHQQEQDCADLRLALQMRLYSNDFLLVK